MLWGAVMFPAELTGLALAHNVHQPADTAVRARVCRSSSDMQSIRPGDSAYAPVQQQASQLSICTRWLGATAAVCLIA